MQIDISFMFYNCKKLTSLNILNFDTTNIKKMESLFSMCENLLYVDLSNFNTKNINNMSQMFLWM